MLEQRIKMGEGGRVIIPSAYRKALGVHPGDELVIRMKDGELRLFQQAEALERIREVVKRDQRKDAHTDRFLAFRHEDSGQ